jgi:ABC-2 type transport system ATP-binding protein
VATWPDDQRVSASPDIFVQPPIISTQSSGAAVEFRDVSKSFGPVRAVDGLTISVRRGESVALLGANGAGKTTTLAMLLGLVAPDTGTVALFGAAPRVAVATGRVGAMLQDGGLMPGARVGELLCTLAGLFPSPLPVARVIGIAQLDGLESRRVDRLSGGQLQRVRVAAALIGDPELLVLDEPTAGMDVAARRDFWKTMRSHTSLGRTILFSSHLLEEADHCADRIVVIGQGRLLADGTPAAIKASVGLKVIACCVADVSAGRLADLPGVAAVDVDRGRARISSNNADATLRALLAAYPEASDIDVRGVALEDAFLALSR